MSLRTQNLSCGQVLISTLNGGSLLIAYHANMLYSRRQLYALQQGHCRALQYKLTFSVFVVVTVLFSSGIVAEHRKNWWNKLERIDLRQCLLKGV